MRPPLIVSRAVAACGRCRKSKVKCDGMLPACTACEKAGRAAECFSTSNEFAKGKERSYVATLEGERERLVRKIAEARARRPSVISIEVDQVTSPVRSPNGSVQAPGGRATKQKEDSDIDELVADFGLVSVNATARDFHGFTKAMSYARLILSASGRKPLPGDMNQVLPPRQVAISMVERYCSYVFVVLPVFEEASFFASFSRVYDGDSRRASSWDNFIVRMVLAIGCCWLSATPRDNYYRDAVGHVTAALKHADQVIQAGTVSSVQAIVLLVQYAAVDPHHFDAYTLIAAAMRAMVDLGFHQDPPRGTKMTKAKLDMRRRIFHCVYALDRSIGIVYGQALSIYDEAINVTLPASATSMSSNFLPNLQFGSHSFGGALDYFRVRQIQSAWYQDLFQSGREPWPEPYDYVWKACSNMHGWFENLSTSNSKPVNSWFQLELLWSLVYLLAPSDRIPYPCEYAQNLLFEYCIQYADQMTKMLNNSEHQAHVTVFDLRRVHSVGQRFIETLARQKDRLLSGIAPLPPSLPQESPAPPSLPATHGDDMVPRAIGCINQTLQLLEMFGDKWDDMALRDRFERESASILADLHQRQRSSSSISSERGMAAYHEHRVSASDIPSPSLSNTFHPLRHHSAAEGTRVLPSLQSIGLHSGRHASTGSAPSSTHRQLNGHPQVGRHYSTESAPAFRYLHSNGMPQVQRHASAESARAFGDSRSNGITQAQPRHASTEIAPAFNFGPLNDNHENQRHLSTESAPAFAYASPDENAQHQRHRSTESASTFSRHGSAGTSPYQLIQPASYMSQPYQPNQSSIFPSDWAFRAAEPATNSFGNVVSPGLNPVFEEYPFQA